MHPFTLDNESCRRARLARDARFDGLFFVAVKTTGIYCRPVCPAPSPKERNVRYFSSALAASQQGFRPCLRCRPEAAPGSPAWRGTDTTLARAVKLIDQGGWQGQSLAEFAERLGIGERHLRQLFQDGLGTSPQRYRTFRRVMLAKQLLHQSSLPIADVALASGFGSVRRCNAAFQQVMAMPPSQLRRNGNVPGGSGEGLSLFLSYRPPYNWLWLQAFFARRAIDNLELVTEQSYQRALQLPAGKGVFWAEHHAGQSGFRVRLWLENPEDTAAAIATVRRILDLDADRQLIDQQLCRCPAMAENYLRGIPLPGMPSPFEAGVRAILGQQISVTAARNLAAILVAELGEPLGDQLGEDFAKRRLFPAAEAVATSRLAFLPMPGSRRETLRRFADYIASGGSADPGQWLALKGIGQWTVDYVRLRLGDPDIWLGADLGVRKGVELLSGKPQPEQWRPWRSYASLQMWQRLAALK